MKHEHLCFFFKSTLRFLFQAAQVHHESPQQCPTLGHHGNSPHSPHSLHPGRYLQIILVIRMPTSSQIHQNISKCDTQLHQNGISIILHRVSSCFIRLHCSTTTHHDQRSDRSTGHRVVQIGHLTQAMNWHLRPAMAEFLL